MHNKKSASKINKIILPFVKNDFIIWAKIFRIDHKPEWMWSPIGQWSQCGSCYFILIVATLKWSRNKVEKKMAIVLCFFSAALPIFYLIHCCMLHFLHFFLSRNLKRSSGETILEDNKNVTQGSNQNISPSYICVSKCPLNLSPLEALSLSF